MDRCVVRLTDEERLKKLDVPRGRIRLVIDTDTKNEVDDQFAVSWALRSPERFDVEALYAAPFSADRYELVVNGIKKTASYAPAQGMEASYEELIKLFSLLGEEASGRVFRGSERYITGSGPIESDAATDLIQRAMASEEILYVAAIGAPTNVASALMLEPRIAKRIAVIWLGGQPLYFGHGTEFNLVQDIEASRVLLDSGVPLILVPCMNVASQLTLSEPEIRGCLLGKNAICDYLAKLVLDVRPDAAEAERQASALRRTYLKGREDRSEDYLSSFKTIRTAFSRIIWDVSTIAYLKNPGWTPSSAVPSPVLGDDFSWGAAEGRHLIRIVNYCFRDMIFGDMESCLAKNVDYTQTA